MRAAARCLVAFAALAGIAVQIHQMHATGNTLGNALSLFTIQSNAIAAVALFAGPRFPMLRGAATSYITMTAIVYALVLGGLYRTFTLTISWDNVVLHEAVPLFMLAEWYAAPSPIRGAVTPISWWLVYPLAYLSYTLIRGAHVHWYPYVFLDPERIGALAVGFVSVVLALLAVGISVLLVRRSHSQNVVRMENDRAE